MKKNKIALSVIFIICISSLYAKDYNANIGQIEPKQAIDSIKNLIESIGEVTGNKITANVVPINRGISLVMTGQADLYGPCIEMKDQKIISQLEYIFSTAYIYKIVWVLYKNKNKNIDVSQLKKGSLTNLTIETDSSIAKSFFNFPVKESRTMVDSLKKVDAGTIDGYIFIQPPTDMTLKQLGLKNIRRVYYDTYNVKFIIGKTPKSKEIDAMISKGIDKLKKDGRYNQIMSLFIPGEKYVDWQP